MLENSDDLFEVVTGCLQSDWWTTKPKPAYVPDEIAKTTEGVRLLGFSMDPTVRKTQGVDARFNDVLCEVPEQVRNIEYFAISKCDLTGDEIQWMNHLRSLRYAEFHKCKLDRKTLGALQLAEEIGALTLVDCVLEDAAALAGLPNARVIQLVDTKVPAEQLLRVREHLPGSMLQSFRLEKHEQAIPLLPPAKAIYRPPTESLKRIRDAMRRMSEHLTGLGLPPDEKQAWDPAETEQVEKAIGYELPSDLRFALSMNTGQFNDIVCRGRFLNGRNMISDTRDQQTVHWRVPEFFNLRDARGRWHYPLVTFMGEGALNICVNLITGEVVERESVEGEVIAPSLAAFFERFADKVEASVTEKPTRQDWEIYSFDLAMKEPIPFGEFGAGDD